MNILFVCTHNACRSILSEVLTNSAGNPNWQARSAGSTPAGRVHPLTIEQLNKRGYATDNLASEGYEAFEQNQPDVVITVCDRAAGEACPLWLGEAVKVHWGLPDPTHPTDPTQDVEQAFEFVIETIKKRVAALQDIDPQLPKPQLHSALSALADLYAD